MSDILKFFRSEHDLETGKTIYYCLSCSITYSHKNVTKMKKHIHTKCPGSKELLSSDIPSNNVTIISEVNFDNSSHFLREPAVKRSKVNKAKSSTTTTQCISKSEQDILAEKLAHAISTSKCPFNLVENEAWIEFFHCIQPSFKVPSRKFLSELTRRNR